MEGDEHRGHGDDMNSPARPGDSDEPAGHPPLEIIDTGDGLAEVSDDPFHLQVEAAGRARPGLDEACLLIHGSTGTAADVRPMGEYLHGRGFTVDGISLPGHARRPADLAGIGWQDCFTVVREAWLRLRERHRPLHVIGFSFGGALALHLAASEPVDNLVVLAPGLHVYVTTRQILGASLGLVPGTPLHTRLRWNLNLLGFFRQVAAELPRVRSPILVMHARDDPLVKVRSSEVVHERVGSEERRLVILEEGGHLLPWGPAHRRVWDEIEQHLLRCGGEPSAAG